MNNLIINKLYIFSPNEKKAKMIPFTKGINIVTSSKVDGNKKGKSIILKSIFHTLGADSFFDDKWDTQRKIYVIDFSVNKGEYYICRCDRLFKIFNSDFNLLFKTIDRKDLAQFLYNIFNFAVELPNRTNDKLEVTSPVYNYLINYIDQDKMDCTKFNSFKSLQEYADYKTNTLYYHIGIFDNQYYTLIKDIEKFTVDEDKLTKEQSTIQEVIKRVKEGLDDFSFTGSFELLEIDLSQYNKEYDEIVTQLRKIRNTILDMRNNKIDIINMFKELKETDNTINIDIDKLNQHICPFCSTKLKDTTHLRVLKYNDSEDIRILYLDLEAQTMMIDKKIVDAEEKYKSISIRLKEYEDRIQINKKEVTDILKNKGMREILDKFTFDLGKTTDGLLKVINELNTLKKKKRIYDKKKKAVNETYAELMTADSILFGLQEIDTERFKNIENTFEAGGSNKPIATIIWYFNLLRVKYTFNADSIRFPMVLDSPNNVELDDEKRKELFEYLFKNADENTQLIISTLGFDSKDYLNIKINNIVNLENKKYSLLDENEYIEYEKILAKCNEN